MIFHSSHGEDGSFEFLANARCVGPHSRPKVRRQKLLAIFGAEDNVDYVLGVSVGHVPHLRRSITLYTIYPALSHWANLCHAYGAKEEPTTCPLPVTSRQRWVKLCRAYGA